MTGQIAVLQDAIHALNKVQGAAAAGTRAPLPRPALAGDGKLQLKDVVPKRKYTKRADSAIRAPRSPKAPKADRNVRTPETGVEPVSAPISRLDPGVTAAVRKLPEPFTISALLANAVFTDSKTAYNWCYNRTTDGWLKKVGRGEWERTQLFGGEAA